MTVVPYRPGRQLTVDEYTRLDEDELVRYELQEGSLVVSPRPTTRHIVVLGQLFLQLSPKLPADLRALQEADLDLELAPPSDPGFVRCPDLVVVRREAVDRTYREGGLLRASEALLVVEIVSPGSKRTDQVIKRGEYADAGIPHYWIIDPAEPVSLIDCHLAEGFGYQDPGAVTGGFTTTEPFAVRLLLDQLR